MNPFRELIEIRGPFVQRISAFLIDTQSLFKGELRIEVEDTEG